MPHSSMIPSRNVFNFSGLGFRRPAGSSASWPERLLRGRRRPRRIRTLLDRFQASAVKPVDARPVAGAIGQHRHAHAALGTDIDRLRLPERAHDVALRHLKSDAARYARSGRGFRRTLGGGAARPAGALGVNEIVRARRDPSGSPARHKRRCWWEGRCCGSAGGTRTCQASSNSRRQQPPPRLRHRAAIIRSYPPSPRDSPPIYLRPA